MTKNLFEKNLNALNLTAPNHAAKIANFKNDNTLPVTMTVGETESIWISQEQTGSFPHGTPLQPILEEQHLIVLYGMGDGECAKRLIAKPEVLHLLIYEPSLSLFKSLMEQKDLTDLILNPKVFFHLGFDERTVLGELESYFADQALRYYYAGFFNNQVSAGIQNIPDYQNFVLKFAESFRTAINNYTNTIKSEPVEDMFRGFMNSVRNVANFSKQPDITDFQGLLKGLPAVVIGSGPSLKFSLPYLKKIQNHAVLFSCDSTLKVLLKEGIKPHFVCVLERSPWQSDFVRDIPDADRPTLIAPMLCHPLVFQAHTGLQIGIRRNIGFDQWLFPQSKTFYLGRFVSHLCIASASILGCTEILLTGLDSAYAPPTPDKSFEDTVYLESATEQMKKIARDILQTDPTMKQQFEITGYDGKPKKTNYYWYTFSQTYGDIISHYAIPSVKNIMPVDHGIPLPRTQRADPEFLLSLAGQNENNLRSNLENAIKNVKFSSPDWETVIKKTDVILQKMKFECLNQSIALSEFLAMNYPTLPDNMPRYKPFFEKIENHRRALMTDNDGIFMSLLVPFILNKHALMEHELRKVHTTAPSQSVLLTKKVYLYQDWYHDVVLNIDRILMYLEKEKLLHV